MKDNRVNNDYIKRHTKIIAFSVICLLVITISFSYSAYFSIKTNKANQTVTAGTLNLQLYGTADLAGTNATVLNQKNLNFQSDTDGLENSEFSYFTLTNPADALNAYYYLTIMYDSSIKAISEQIPIEFFNAALYTCTAPMSNCTQKSDIFNLGDLVITDGTEETSEFKFWEDTLEAGKNIYYAMKIWLSDKYKDQEFISGSEIHLKVGFHSRVLETMKTYTIKGTYGDFAAAGSTWLWHSSAKLSLVNGKYTATTDSDGVFSIEVLCDGINSTVYNVSGTGQNLSGLTPLGTIVLSPNNTTELLIPPKTVLIEAGNFYKAVKTNSTTINALHLNYNTATGASNTYTFSGGRGGSFGVNQMNYITGFTSYSTNPYFGPINGEAYSLKIASSTTG